MKQQSELCKARSLFIGRGILNESIISKTIMHSWVRSQLHHISFEMLKTSPEIKKVNLANLNIMGKELMQYIRNLSSDHSVIYLLDDQALVVYENNQIDNHVPEIKSFSEEYIGSSAGGISMHSHDDCRVFGCEHYNQELTHFITETLVVKHEGLNRFNMILVLTPLRFASHHDHLCQRLRHHFQNQTSQVKAKKKMLADEPGHISKDEVDKSPVKVVNKCDVLEEVVSEECNVSKECKVFTLSIIEKNTIVEALDFYKWNLKKTAQALGIGRSTLYRKLKDYHIERDMGSKS